MFKKKKEKEVIKKEEETATIIEKETKPEEELPQAKLLIDMTEPERFIHIYNEISEIKILLAELVEVAKAE